MDEELMRMMVGQLYLLNLQIASKDMFGRGYLSLGPDERVAIGNMVWGQALGTVQWLTKETLTGEPSPAQPAGFVQPGKP